MLGERGRRAAVQRRQLGRAPGRRRPSRAPIRSRSRSGCSRPNAGSRAVVAASIARLDRRRQPRLRADARSRPAVLRADPFLAGQRDRRARRAAAAARTPGRSSSSPTTARAAPRASGCISNGAPLATEVIRDRLYKDITYDPAPATTSASTPPLTIGARFRDSGFKNGLIDDLQIFSTRADRRGSRRGGRPASSDRRGLRRISSPASIEPSIAAARPSSAAAARGGERARRRRAGNHGDGGDAARRGRRICSTAAPTMRRGEIVARDTPASLPPFPADQPRNRLGLARWLTRRDNPLAARVVVNRIWRMHFGRGIVATPGGLRQPGPAADASRAARLARRDVHGERLGREGAAPADRARRRRSSSPRHVPAEARGARSGQPAARPRPEARAWPRNRSATARSPRAAC